MKRESYNQTIVNSMFQVSPRQLQVVGALDQSYQAIAEGGKIAVVGFTPAENDRPYLITLESGLQVATARDVIKDMIAENEESNGEYLSYKTPANVPEGIILGPHNVTLLVRPELNPVVQKLSGKRLSQIPNPDADYLEGREKFPKNLSGRTQYPRRAFEERLWTSYGFNFVTDEEFDALYEIARQEESTNPHERTVLSFDKKGRKGKPLLWDYWHSSDFLMREPTEELLKGIERRKGRIDEMNPLESGIRFAGPYRPNDVNLRQIREREFDNVPDHVKYVDLDFQKDEFVGLAGLAMIQGTALGISPYPTSFHSEGMRAMRDASLGLPEPHPV